MRMERITSESVFCAYDQDCKVVRLSMFSNVNNALRPPVTHIDMLLTAPDHYTFRASPGQIIFVDRLGQSAATPALSAVFACVC